VERTVGKKREHVGTYCCSLHKKAKLKTIFQIQETQFCRSCKKMTAVDDEIDNQQGIEI
jgi:hypothetical protein